jgi:hypothetical protein
MFTIIPLMLKELSLLIARRALSIRQGRHYADSRWANAVISNLRTSFSGTLHVLRFEPNGCTIMTISLRLSMRPSMEKGLVLPQREADVGVELSAGSEAHNGSHSCWSILLTPLRQQ